MLQLWFFANTILAQIYGQISGFNLSMNVIVLLLAGVILARQGRGFTRATLRIILGLSLYFVFSFIVILSGPCSSHPIKSLITSPIVFFLIVTGLKVGSEARAQDWLKLRKTAEWALLCAFASFAFEAAVPSLFPDKEHYRLQWQLSGIFPEPSHVAVSLFACLAVLLLAEDKRTRMKGWLAALLLLIVSRPTTLVALIITWISYRAIVHGKLRQAAKLVFAMGVLIAVAAAVDYRLLVQPTATRLSGLFVSSEESNITSLVYIQGWEDAWVNLVRTHGLGLGVNMMGCGELPDILPRTALTLIGQETLNADDGSFLFGKVVSEAGIMGILLYMAIIWRWIHRERQMRYIPVGPEREAASIQNALVFSFVMASFLRTSGYFDGIMLLGIVGLVAPQMWRKTEIEEEQHEASDSGRLVDEESPTNPSDGEGLVPRNC
jgi:hypothetical protein